MAPGGFKHPNISLDITCIEKISGKPRSAFMLCLLAEYEMQFSKMRGTWDSCAVCIFAPITAYTLLSGFARSHGSVGCL